MDPTPTTARLFACEPTPAERAAYRTRNKAAALTMFDVPAELEPVETACPACAGIGTDCTCHRTGASALELELEQLERTSCPPYDANCLRCRYAMEGDHRYHVATRTTFDRAELEARIDEGPAEVVPSCNNCGRAETCTCTSAQRDEYRLTPEDEATITGRLAWMVADWKAGAWTTFTPTADMVTALERAGAHAIGCARHDLRASELEWITARALEALELEAR